MFKKGDRVRRIKGDNDRHMIKGNIYTVRAMDNARDLYVEGIREGWTAEYFELVKDERVLKVGDTVTIRKDLKTGDYGCDSAVRGMLEQAGKTLKIREINKNGKNISYNLEGTGWFTWTPEMFELPNAEELAAKEAERIAKCPYKIVDIKFKVVEYFDNLDDAEKKLGYYLHHGHNYYLDYEEQNDDNNVA